MALQESGEMYLESILRLSQKQSMVRSVDVCEYMGYSKPSISRAVGLLKKGGYLEVADDGNLTLTPSGRAVAEKIFERHRVLTEWLLLIGVSEETAQQDACKLEHAISDESLMALKGYLADKK